MNLEGRLVFAVILKNEDIFAYEELNPQFSVHEFDESEDADEEDYDCKEYSLESCFQAYQKEDLMSGSNQWHCSACNSKRDAVKKAEIYKAPPVLFIHLKRFQQRGYSSYEKNTEEVEFPISDFDIRPYVTTLRDASEPVIYDLIGVTNHYGSLAGGHYKAHCLNPLKNEWYEFNDSSVSTRKSGIVSRAAYLLWYRKRDLHESFIPELKASAQNLKLVDIEVTRGTLKYIQVTLVPKQEANSQSEPVTIVRGYLGCLYHIDVFTKFNEEEVLKNTEFSARWQVDRISGGHIQFDETEKRATIYGDSDTFGPADH